jgi:hypothetical protein
MLTFGLVDQIIRMMFGLLTCRRFDMYLCMMCQPFDMLMIWYAWCSTFWHVDDLICMMCRPFDMSTIWYVCMMCRPFDMSTIWYVWNDRQYIWLLTTKLSRKGPGRDCHRLFGVAHLHQDDVADEDEGLGGHVQHGEGRRSEATGRRSVDGGLRPEVAGRSVCESGIGLQLIRHQRTPALLSAHFGKKISDADRTVFFNHVGTRPVYD